MLYTLKGKANLLRSFVALSIIILFLLLYLQVFQGLLRAHKDYHDTKNAMSRLWVHECFRVFCDRLVGDKDQETFVSLISEKLGSIFDLTYHNLCPNKIPPVFGEHNNPT